MGPTLGIVIGGAGSNDDVPGAYSSALASGLGSFVWMDGSRLSEPPSTSTRPSDRATAAWAKRAVVSEATVENARVEGS